MVNIDGARRIGSFAQRTIHSFLCDAHLFFRLVYFPLICVCVKRIDACVMRVCVLQPRVSLLFSSLLFFSSLLSSRTFFIIFLLDFEYVLSLSLAGF